MARKSGAGPGPLSRRRFFLQTATGFSAAWLSLHWPSVVSAATHARHAAQSSDSPHLQFLTPDEAKEIDAIAARIIPTDDSPGAREAGAVYFIDRALLTFASDQQKTYRDGLPDFQSHVRQQFPGVARFSAATTEQQDAILASLDKKILTGRAARALRARQHQPEFLETVRQHTIVAFLIDPEFGANSKGVGWQLIGREPAHTFASPFGYYDKDYQGWKPVEKGGS